MEFCSKYGYDYGFNGSDEESLSDEEINNNSNNEKKLKKVRKADSNIIAVKFDQLVLTNQMFAGEPLKCKTCEAFMSSISLKSLSNDKKIWKCEFCYTENDISKIGNLDAIPNNDDTTYLIEPAPVNVNSIQTDDSKASNVKSTDSNYLLYCIDISGSMDTIIPVKENNSQQRGMNRLEGVKIACVENLNTLKDEEPNKRVGLVTFSDVVKFYGDATKLSNNQPLLNIGSNLRYSFNSFIAHGPVVKVQKPKQKSSVFGSIKSKVFGNSSSKKSSDDDDDEKRNDQDEEENTSKIPQDIMTNKEKMMALGENQQGDLEPVSKSHNYLQQRIKQLHTEGSTALGPALVFSVGYSCRQRGSQIILCTDGCANIGMGSVETNQSAEKFYEDLADEAKNKGVTVNVISMEGTDCKLALLGRVADKTNGSMNIVNPLNLSEQFKSILENRIVATEVKAKLIVNNKYLYIRNDDLESAEAKAYESGDQKQKLELEKLKTSVLEKDIGNANIDTEITFEYGIKRLDENKSKNEGPLKEMPFQLQITYTSSDGAKAVRVYTKIQEFTKERNLAEKAIISEDLIWSNYAQKMSNHVIKSDVSTAQYRGHQISRFTKANKFEAPTQFSNNLERVKGLNMSFKSAQMNDEFAQEMYQAKKINRKFFKK